MPSCHRRRHQVTTDPADPSAFCPAPGCLQRDEAALRAEGWGFDDARVEQVVYYTRTANSDWEVGACCVGAGWVGAVRYGVVQLKNMPAGRPHPNPHPILHSPAPGVTDPCCRSTTAEAPAACSARASRPPVTPASSV